MTRRCDITGKTVLVGHNVSHSNIKTKRRFLPNLHILTFYSEILGRKISFRMTTKGIRTIEHNHGLDNYLLSTPASRLSYTALKLKKMIKKELQKSKLATA